MVDPLKPTFATYSTKTNAYSKAGAARGVEGHIDDKQPKERLWNRKERRGRGDRRHNSATTKKRTNFEMRSSLGRRRTDRTHPSIETKA